MKLNRLAGAIATIALLSGCGLTHHAAAPAHPATGWGSPNAQVLVPLLARYASP